MSKITEIEWCDNTFNHVIGCTKVSAECDNCYAEHSTPARNLGIKWGPRVPRYRTSDENWRKPLSWEAEAKQTGNPRRVFCASLADWLDPEIAPDVTADLMALICETPHLQWLMPTNRPELFEKVLKRASFSKKCTGRAMMMMGEWLAGAPPINVWVGVTIGCRSSLNRTVRLSNIPAVIRFVSQEPTLQEIPWTDTLDFLRKQDLQIPNWIIVGGESGPKARRCDIQWILKTIRACREYGVTPFVKQLGSNAGATYKEDWHPMRLNHPKGGDIGEWPFSLRVREFPVAPVF
jgi:protein gp37